MCIRDRFGAVGFGKTLRFDPLTQLFDIHTRSRTLNAGVSGTRGPLTGTVTLQRATTDDWQLMEASGIFLKRVAPSYGLHDADVDLSRPLTADCKLAIFTPKNPEGLDLARHDAAHIVASVVQKLFPGTQVTIGPTTDDGFYYDFHRDTPFTPCLLYTSPSPRDRTRSRMPSSA